MESDSQMKPSSPLTVATEKQTLSSGPTETTSPFSPGSEEQQSTTRELERKTTTEDGFERITTQKPQKTTTTRINIDGEIQSTTQSEISKTSSTISSTDTKSTTQGTSEETATPKTTSGQYTSPETRSTTDSATTVRDIEIKSTTPAITESAQSATTIRDTTDSKTSQTDRSAVSVTTESSKPVTTSESEINSTTEQTPSATISDRDDLTSELPKATEFETTLSPKVTEDAEPTLTSVLVSREGIEEFTTVKTERPEDKVTSDIVGTVIFKNTTASTADKFAITTKLPETQPKETSTIEAQAKVTDVSSDITTEDYTSTLKESGDGFTRSNGYFTTVDVTTLPPTNTPIPSSSISSQTSESREPDLEATTKFTSSPEIKDASNTTSADKVTTTSFTISDGFSTVLPKVITTTPRDIVTAFPSITTDASQDPALTTLVTNDQSGFTTSKSLVKSPANISVTGFTESSGFSTRSSVGTTVVPTSIETVRPEEPGLTPTLSTSYRTEITDRSDVTTTEKNLPASYTPSGGFTTIVSDVTSAAPRDIVTAFPTVEKETGSTSNPKQTTIIAERESESTISSSDGASTVGVSVKGFTASGGFSTTTSEPAAPTSTETVRPEVPVSTMIISTSSRPDVLTTSNVTTTDKILVTSFTPSDGFSTVISEVTSAAPRDIVSAFPTVERESSSTQDPKITTEGEVESTTSSSKGASTVEVSVKGFTASGGFSTTTSEATTATPTSSETVKPEVPGSTLIISTSSPPDVPITSNNITTTNKILPTSFTPSDGFSTVILEVTSAEPRDIVSAFPTVERESGSTKDQTVTTEGEAKSTTSSSDGAYTVEVSVEGFTASGGFSTTTSQATAATSAETDETVKPGMHGSTVIFSTSSRPEVPIISDNVTTTDKIIPTSYTPSGGFTTIISEVTSAVPRDIVSAFPALDRETGSTERPKVVTVTTEDLAESSTYSSDGASTVEISVGEFTTSPGFSTPPEAITSIGPMSTETLSPGCFFEGSFFGEGSYIPGDDPCILCYCIDMKVTCNNVTCSAPLEATGCKPVPPTESQCCPVEFECESTTINSTDGTTETTTTTIRIETGPLVTNISAESTTISYSTTSSVTDYFTEEAKLTSRNPIMNDSITVDTKDTLPQSTTSVVEKENEITTLKSKPESDEDEDGLDINEFLKKINASLHSTTLSSLSQTTVVIPSSEVTSLTDQESSEDKETVFPISTATQYEVSTSKPFFSSTLPNVFISTVSEDNINETLTKESESTLISTVTQSNLVTSTVESTHSSDIAFKQASDDIETTTSSKVTTVSSSENITTPLVVTTTDSPENQLFTTRKIKTGQTQTDQPSLETTTLISAQDITQKSQVTTDSSIVTDKYYSETEGLADITESGTKIPEISSSTIYSELDTSSTAKITGVTGEEHMTTQDVDGFTRFTTASYSSSTQETLDNVDDKTTAGIKNETIKPGPVTLTTLLIGKTGTTEVYENVSEEFTTKVPDIITKSTTETSSTDFVLPSDNRNETISVEKEKETGSISTVSTMKPLETTTKVIVTTVAPLNNDTESAFVTASDSIENQFSSTVKSKTGEIESDQSTTDSATIISTMNITQKSEFTTASTSSVLTDESITEKDESLNTKESTEVPSVTQKTETSSLIDSLDNSFTTVKTTDIVSQRQKTTHSPSLVDTEEKIDELTLSTTTTKSSSSTQETTDIPDHKTKPGTQDATHRPDTVTLTTLIIGQSDRTTETFKKVTEDSTTTVSEISTKSAQETSTTIFASPGDINNETISIEKETNTENITTVTPETSVRSTKPDKPQRPFPTFPPFIPPSTSEGGQIEQRPEDLSPFEPEPSEQPFVSPGFGACLFDNKIYVSAQQIPREDPCDFCFCFRGDIICLQQSCPPPILGCYEEIIPGFCCPRFECHVSQALINVTTTPAPTTTPSWSLVSGCEVDGNTYQMGELIEKASGPCLECR